MKRVLVGMMLLACSISVRAQRSAPLDSAVTAKTVGVTAGVEWPKKSEILDGQAELDRIFHAVDNSALYSHYKWAKAARADIIIKIDEDRTIDRISMSVLNPDDNSEIYSESRDLVALDNDINRLVAHFINAVKEVRSNSQAEPESASQPEIQWKNLKDGQIYSTRMTGEKLRLESVESYPSVVADILSCDFTRAVSFGVSWIGSCAERNHIDQSVFRSDEFITLFSNARIEARTFVLVPLAEATESDQVTPQQHTPSDGNVRSTLDTTASGASYLWVGRFQREDRAHEAEKKIAALGLPAAVVAKHEDTGDSYILYSGPYLNAKIPGAMQQLEAKGFSNLRAVPLSLVSNNASQ